MKLSVEGAVRADGKVEALLASYLSLNVVSLCFIPWRVFADRTTKTCLCKVLHMSPLQLIFKEECVSVLNS